MINCKSISIRVIFCTLLRPESWKISLKMKAEDVTKYLSQIFYCPFITILKVEDQLRLLITELLSHSFRSQTQPGRGYQRKKKR